MRRMKLPREKEEEASPYHSKLEKWTDKEMQLNILHEEIITKREALLRTQRNYLSRTGLEDLPLSDTEAAIRNDRLLKEISELGESISEHLNTPPSPAFANLQKNYWTMVTNTFPIWNKSMEGTTGRSKLATGGTGAGARSVTLSDLAHV